MNETHGPVCGHCGKAVAAADVTCPHCGVLLAAYQSPSGAATGSASATQPVGSTPFTPSMTASPPPPTPTYATTSTVTPVVSPPSPIAEAMERTKQSFATSIPIAPAAGEDELTEMARANSGFAREVEEELKEAKVVFDDKAGATIETAPGHADVIVSPPATQPVPAQPPVKPVPARELDAADAPEAQGRPAKKGWKANPILIAIFLIFLVAGFRNPAALTFLGIALFIGYIFFRVVISASKANARTTTRMPKDTSGQYDRR